jgi:asparagine synthase (glutamine-hydrolysing)
MPPRMCGIAVILPGSAVRTSPFAIQRMTDALIHRGPDAQAVVRLPGCHLGHTRLSVIDLNTGGQPMSDPTGQFTIVFNGEIYNYRSLRSELESLGHVLRTTSDTEVLLHACIRFGAEAPQRLNGQFAFAFWNARDQALLAARDRFGEKPLFWARGRHGELLLASEIKAILASELIEPQIDPISVDAYLGLHYVPPHRTIYENVHTIAPAHTAEWENGRFHSTRYWQPRIGENDLDATEAVAEIARRLDTAVQRQMTADIPVGAFLSGGLDSTTIVALMQRQSASPVSTFSVGFGDLINELPFASDVARQYGTDHHELQMDIDVAENLQRMNQVYDEPFADSSNIPTYLVAEYARQHLKVVLSGDGGDELFGGYEWYRPLLDPSADDDAFRRHLLQSTHVLADRRQLWAMNQPESSDHLTALYRSELRGVDAAVSFDCHCYLPGDILVKVDRAAMAHGLESRAPFLDVELAEFVLGLSAKLRFGDRRFKGLLRAAFQHLWPSSVRGRAKQGFGAPVRAWLELPAVKESWIEAQRPDGPLNALLPGLSQITADLRPQRKWTMLCLAQWLESRTTCLANLP